MKHIILPDVREYLKKRHVSLNTKQLFDGSRFEPPCEFSGYVQFGAFSMGAFSFSQGGRFNHVTIGRYCSIAPDVTIGAYPHPTDWLSTNPFQYSFNHKGWCELSPEYDTLKTQTGRAVPYKPELAVTIGNDVWIGQRAILKHNIVIGNGAVIAGGAVVTKDVPPYAIVAGVPATIIRMRFDDAVIDRLERLRWWRFSQWDLAGVPFNNVSQSIDLIEARVQEEGLKEWCPGYFTLEKNGMFAIMHS